MRLIKNGISWRWFRYNEIIRDLVRSFWATIKVTFRWHLKSGPLRPHQIPGTLIVSLTSYPPRFNTLALTLRSLLRQTIKADHIILWVAHSDHPMLPRNIIEMQDAGLEIRATDDIKSYIKIIPALEAFPDAFICTADDDIYYWPTWLRELTEGTGAADHIVRCHRVHEITFDDSTGAFKPYKQWAHDTRRRGRLSWLFPTGVGGVLYPPGILAHTVDDRRACLQLCPHGDDIWLYWIGRRNGAVYETTKCWHRLITWFGSQKVALWPDNFRDRNDEQIRQMAARYGYPEH
jgi:hypothetical protein